MLIANPIYDTVFKYMMENIDVAKGIISTIIGEEIVHLDFKAQENILETEKKFTVYHLDFAARIKQENGAFKNVLIELQKTNLPYDITRFRKYLGEQYRKEDDVLVETGTSSREALPLITIYFLGFFISHTLPAVIKVNRQYIDLLEGREIKERNDFIECLTHDSFVIQIPALHLEMKTRLEYVLSIFKQENFIYDKHHLKDYKYETDDKLMKEILNRLMRAAGDKELLHRLDLEELAEREYENAFGAMERKMAKQEKALEENKKALEENKKALEENKKALEENKKTLEEKEKYIDELLKKLDNK
jgi:hypothetical protein